MHDKPIQLLSKRRFLPLFITQFLQAFNDNVFKNALVILIAYQLTTAGTEEQIMVTLAAGLFILPFFLFSATAGQLADKLEKSLMIQVIKFFEVVLMVVGSFGFVMHSTPLLLTTLFLIGVHSAFFGPLKYSILPDHLKKSELIGGNALIEASTFIAILLGMIVGGVFITAKFGVPVISLIIIGVAAAGWLSSFYIPKAGPADPSIHINLNFIKETWHIVQHSRHNREVFLSILAISWFWLIGTIFLSEFPTFAKDVIGANPNIVTLFLAMFSIGIAIGSLLSEKMLDGDISAKYVPMAIFAMTIFITDLFFASRHVVHANSTTLIGISQFLVTPNNWRILADIFLLSVSGGFYIVPLYAIMQSRSEPEYRSRTIASNNIVNSLFMVCGSMAIMLMLALHFTVPQVFLTAAVLNALIAVYTCKLLPEKLLKGFFTWLLKACYQVQIKGLDNYQAAGDKVIIVANHTSLLDILLISTFLPDKFTVAVNPSLSNKWWLRPFLTLVEVLPLEPTKPMATKSIIQHIRAGKKCVIFPEGQLKTSPSINKVYEAPGQIADKTGATLLPIRIDGAQNTPFTRIRNRVKVRWFPKITLNIMPPRKYELAANLSGHERRRIMGTKLYTLLSDMTFASNYKKQTLFSTLLDARSINKGRFKVVEDVERKPLNYNQLIARSFILGKQIAKATEAGEHVGILLPTMVGTIITFYAMHAYGRIPTMLNFSAGIRNILSACKTANVKTIYTSQKFITTAKLEDTAKALEDAGLNVVYLEEFRNKISIFAKIAGLIKGKFARQVYLNTGENAQSSDTAVVLFTSGSEGTPKGVLLSHENLIANCTQLISRVDMNANDVMFNAMPVFHCFGLTVGSILPTLIGIRAFFYPSPLHYRIVPELVYDTNATIMFGTDTFLTGYARYAHSYDFYSIRYIFAGAEKLRPETSKIWSEKFGVRLFEGYGATETAPVVSANTVMLNKLGSVGCFLPEIEYRLENVEGIDTGGRLFLRGPNIMQGYLHADNPDVIDAPKDGWHDTGDIVDVDTDGFITIKGRAKRFAKIGGEMISLTGVEAYISQLWPEQLHAVVSIPDEKRGEQLVLLTDCKTATREVLISFVRQQGYSELSIPKMIHVMTEVPVLATGKIDYVSSQEYVAHLIEKGEHKPQQTKQVEKREKPAEALLDS